MHLRAELHDSEVKHLPVIHETRVGSLGWEDPLEEEKATHSSSFAQRISWTGELAGYSPWGHEESDMTEPLSTCSTRLW